MTTRGTAAARTHVATNRRLWERQAVGYERHAGRFLSGRRAMAWGFWRIPESELRLLGPVRGRDVLEIGCGAGRWLVALAGRAARPVGLDLSRRRLDQARGEMRRARRRVPLVEGDAERLPFADATFDVVFCDWGAMTFCDPLRTIPEASRVLRDSGRFVFATSSPWRVVCQTFKPERMTRQLQRSYFDLHRIDYPGEVNFVLPYGEWIRRFRVAGFTIEDLVEIQAPVGRATPYLTKSERPWGRRWPLENIWQLRKEPRRASRRSRTRSPRSRTRRPGANSG
ncbi:MAG: class I SAM-dependent methyltransferase [Thermoplasmata archaeon]|nr:class I SAM-dependent methyltransferase [Thermoplasmata archaeon]